MADWATYFKTKSAEQQSAPAAPSGLPATASRFAAQQSSWASAGQGLQPWLPEKSYMETARSWYGGANPNSTQNGWDTDFADKAFSQQYNYLSRAFTPDANGVRHPSTYYSWLDDPAAYGVATWNDPKGRFKVGDVFVEGQKQEGQNLYEVFDEYTADVMLSDFMFNNDERTRFNGDKDVQGRYRREVQSRVESDSAQALVAPQAEQFQTNIKETQAEYQEGWQEPAIIGGAAVATGATAYFGAALAAAGTSFLGATAASSWLGPAAPFIGLAAGVVAGGAAWLNSDSLTETAAYATEVVHESRARASHNLLHETGEAVGLYGGTLGRKMINPVSNAVQGGFDVAHGGLDDVGDGESAFYKLDENGERVASGRWQAADFAAQGADAILLWSSPAGKYLDLGTMGAYTVGSATKILSMEGFNDRIGGYDRYEGASEWVSAIAGFGIDAVQMTTMGGIAQRMKNRTALGGPTGELPEVLSGTRFTLDDMGRATSHKMTLERWAPSEAARWMTVNARARIRAQRSNGVVDSDALYQAAKAMTTDRAWTQAIVNGYAEGVEEFAQGILEPASYSERINPDQLLASTISGVMGGMGMSLGTLSRPADPEKIRKASVKLNFMRANGLETIDDKRFDSHYKGMSESEKDLMSRFTPESTKEMGAAWQVMTDVQRQNLASTSILGQVGLEAVRDAEMRRVYSGANPATDSRVKLLGQNGGTMVFNGQVEKIGGGNTAVLSATQFIRMLGRQVDAWTEMAKAPGVDPAIAADLTSQIQVSLDVFKHFMARYRELMAIVDPDAQKAKIAEMNKEMAWLYAGKDYTTGNDLAADRKWFAQQAIEFKLKRDPFIGAGSVGIYLPQISYALTRGGGDGVVSINQSLIKAPGGDHDGDDFADLNMQWWNREDWQKMRFGGQYVIQGPSAEQVSIETPDPDDPSKTITMQIPGKSTTVVEMDPPDDEDVRIRRITDLLAIPGSAEATIVTDAYAHWYVNVFKPHYVTRGPLSEEQFDDAWLQFLNDMQGGDAEARVKFAERLFNYDIPGMLQLSERYNVPEVAWLWDQITDMHGEIMINQARHNATEFLQRYKRDPKDTVPMSSDWRMPEELKFQEEIAVRDGINQGTTLGLLLGADPNRAAMKVYYTFYRSAVDSWDPKANGWVPERVTDLARQYTFLNSGDVESSVAGLTNVNRIEDRVVNQLVDMASLGNAPVSPQAVLQVAMTRVPNFATDPDTGLGYLPPDAGEISILQLLLRKSVEMEEARIAQIPLDDPVRAKITHFKSLSHAGDKSSYTAKTAFIEVFRDHQLYETVGHDSTYIGPNMTIGQLEDQLMGRDSDTRVAMLAAMRMSPAYHSHHGQGDPPYFITQYESPDGTSRVPINAFTMLVDALTASVNTRTAALKRKDDDGIDALVLMLSNLVAKLDRHKIDHKDRLVTASRVAILNDYLAANPQRAQEIIDALPPDALPAIFQGNRAKPAIWLEQVLAGLDYDGTPATPERLAVNFRVQSWLAQFNAAGGRVIRPRNVTQNETAEEKERLDREHRDKFGVEGAVRYGHLDSRMLQLMHRLAAKRTAEHGVLEVTETGVQKSLRRLRRGEAPPTETRAATISPGQGALMDLDLLIEYMYKATDLYDLRTSINTVSQWHVGREMQLMMLDDKGDFEVDPASIWATNLPSSVQRDNIVKLSEAINLTNEAEVEEAASLSADQEMLRDLKLYHEQMLLWKADPQNVTKPLNVANTARLYALLDKMITNRNKMTDSRGPNIRNLVTDAAVDGLIASHDKGSADQDFAAYGNALITLRDLGVMTDVDLETAAWTAHNWTDVQANLTKLAEGPHRIMLDDGTTLEVDFSDIGFVIDAFNDPRLRSVAYAVLVQTSRDVNANGMAVNYHDVISMSLEQILEEQNFNQVFAENRPILERAHRLFGFIEAHAVKAAEKATVVERDRANDLLQNIINDFVVAYLQQPGVQHQDKEGLRDELFKDLYETVVLISQLKTDEERERLRKELKISLAQRFRDQSEQIAELRRTDVEETLRDSTVVLTLIKYSQQQETKFRKQLTKLGAELLPLTDQAQRDAKQDEIDLVQAQLDLVVEALTQLGTGDPINLPRFDDLSVDTLINQYALTGDPVGDMHRKVDILGVLLEGNTIERYRSDKKTNDLINKAIKMGSHRRKAFFFFPTIRGGMRLKDAEWDILTGWVVSAKISDTVSRGSSQVQLQGLITNAEGLQSQKYYDVTYASLVDDLFDAVLINPVIEMAETSPLPEQLQRPTVKKARDRILNSLFDQRKLGTWTDRVPVEGLKLRSILRNAPVGLAIPRGGDTPRKVMDLIASGHVTVDAKPIPLTVLGGHHSVLTLDNIDHGAVLEDHLRWQDIIKLENHFVHRVVVRPGPKTQASGAMVLPELDMMLTNATQKNFSHPTVDQSGYEVLSIATLQAELDASLPGEGYLDFSLEIEYVDVDKKPYTAEYVNSIYFDGVGRESYVGRGGGPIAQMWLAQGGLSKISQQQPLNWLTKAGKRFRHLTTTGLADVQSLEQSGLSLAELMQMKTMRLLTKDDYDTGYLLREDIPALYKMIKMRHLVVGWEVQPDGSRIKRLYWADQWIQFERTNSEPALEDMNLVYLNESIMQTLLGRMGERGKKGVWGDPNLVLSDGVAMPNLDLERLKDMGLERLGETSEPSNSSLAQVQPRQKVIYRKGEDIRRAQREYDTKMRNWENSAAPIRTARKAQPKSSFDARKQRNTHQATLLDYLLPERFASVISRIGIPVDRLLDPKAYRTTRHMVGRIDKIHKNYPQATISVYIRDGSSNPAEGMYAAAEMDSDFTSVPDYQKPIVKDVWLVDIDAYKRLAGNDDELAYNMAKADLSQLMARGVYVVPVTKQGNIDFRADIITWINKGERGYRAMADDSYMFGPADPTSDVGVNTAAIESTLYNTRVFDGKSPHWAIRVLGPWFDTSENTVNYLPRGQVYRKHAREIIPTSYSHTRQEGGSAYAYNRPTDAIVLGSGGLTQKELTARKLLAILDDPVGLEWLAKDMAKGDPTSRGDLDMYTEHPNGDITEGILPIRKALETLRDELKAGQDPLRKGKVLRAGSADALLSDDGSTVMITRLGFKAPDPHEHDTQAETLYNDLPGGVVIFSNKLEDTHTTTPPLTIDHLTHDKRGFMVVGKYELSDVGKRTNEGLGYKPGAMPWPNKYRPKDISLSRFNDTHITESTSSQAPSGKNAIGGDEGGLVAGFKHMFVLSGFDAWADMVDFFFGHDPKRDPKEYDRLESLVLQILDEWASRDHGYTAAEIETLLTTNVFGNHMYNELTTYAQQIAGPELRAGLEFRYDENNPDAERDDINKRLATIILAQLAVPGIKVHHVMSTPGLLTLKDDSLNTQVRALPDMMMDAMSDIRFWPLKEEMVARANSVFPTDDKGVPVYFFDEDFTFWYMSEDDNGKPLLLDVQLQLVLDQPADQNPVTNIHTNVTKTKQDISPHYAAAIAGATGGQQMSGQDLTVTNERPNIIDFAKGQTLFDVLTRVEENDRTFPTEAPVTPLENNHYRMSAHKVGIYTQPLELNPDPAQPTLVTEVAKAQKDLLLAMGFNIKVVEDMRVEVDYLVRQFLGRPGPDEFDQAFSEEIDAGVYLEIAKIMLHNVQDLHMHPLHGGLVFWEHMSFWKMAYLANQDRPVEQRWGPVIKEGRGKKKIASTWYEWVHALNAQVKDSKYEFQATWRTANDGFWHTYQGAIPEFNTIQLTDNEMVALQLRDPETNERYVSNDPILRQALETPQLMDFATLSFDMIVSEKLAIGTVEDSLEIPFGSMADQVKYHKQWQENNNIKAQKKTTVREYLKEGVLAQESTRRSTLFFRAVVNLSMQRVLVPALWVEAIMAVPTRQALEHVTNMLLGEYTGTGGVELARMRSNPKYSPEDIKLLREAAKMLGSDTPWLAGIIRDTTYRTLAMHGGNSLVGAGLEKFAAWSARLFADPRWGQRGRSAAMRYLEGALDYYDDAGAMITVPQLVDNLRKDSKWIEHSSPKTGVSAHSVGSNRLGQVRQTRNTVVNKMVMSGVESLCASDRMLFAIPGHLVKLPLLFNRFAMNQFMTITGLNVLDQMVAVNLTAKKRGGLWHRSIGARLGQDDAKRGEYDMSDVIDSLDLTRAVARTGVSQTAFMALGFIANGYGLGGEDEEMRRRRRMAMYMDVPLQYDPRRSENDFVNADAIFWDAVPFMGTHYLDPETGRSAMIPHWILRQFTSPMMGIQRFFETGDVREIGFGFLDAAQALPYSVVNTWKEADLTARLLADAAKTEDLDKSAEAQAQTYSLLTRIASVYEKALVESTFVNTMRNGWDQFDRNPWFVPKTNETGDIVMAQGYDDKPLRTNALIQDTRPKLDPVTREPVLDPVTGEPVLENVTAYRQRTGLDAALHQYAENNATAAFLFSLFDGQLGGESSYWRKNMVNVEQKVPLPTSTEADLEALVMSAYLGAGGQPKYTFDEVVRVLKKQDEDAGIYWDQTKIEAKAHAILDAHSEMGAMSIISPEGRELITDDGMEAVFRSLQGGGVTFKDISLQGIHADKPMRDRIAEKWTTALIQEGIDDGMSQQSAEYRMRRFWYGDSTNPEIPGLRALLYSNEIPRADTQKYDQLNVTYALGPDGKPWATPFTRQSIWGAVFPVSQVAPEVGPGMGRDKTRGKDIDLTLGINTGLHGLVRQQEEPIVPDDKPMEKAAAKEYTPTTRGVSRYPFKRFPRRSYGGGGGYSSGGGRPYFQRMQPLPRGMAPQLDGIRQINVNTPFIRRATVHEERISSERGRLKQWQ